ncbi:hypothetical protein GGU45_001103 [Niabella hirudinis]
MRISDDEALKRLPVKDLNGLVGFAPDNCVVLFCCKAYPARVSRRFNKR